MALPAKVRAVLLILGKLLFLVVVAIGLFAIGLFFAQGALIFPASREMDRDPGVFDWDFEDLRFEVMGETTHGWYVPLENHRGVALFSHGNAGNLSGRLESIGLLRSFGLSVLAYDYGGYGYSTGKPSEARCYADVRAMWDFLIREKGFRPDEIILFGRSLGAGPTAELAQSVRPAGVVLESAFLSVPDVAAGNPILRWMTPLIRHRFENKNKVAAIGSPVLIIHSPDDEVIPYAHGQRLFELAREPKSFLEIHGGHNLGFVMSETVYREGWEVFLRETLGST